MIFTFTFSEGRQCIKNIRSGISHSFYDATSEVTFGIGIIDGQPSSFRNPHDVMDLLSSRMSGFTIRHGMFCCSSERENVFFFFIYFNGVYTAVVVRKQKKK